MLFNRAIANNLLHYSLHSVILQVPWHCFLSTVEPLNKGHFGPASHHEFCRDCPLLGGLCILVLGVRVSFAEVVFFLGGSLSEVPPV